MHAQIADRKKRNAGFTMLELVIVLVTVLIVAGIAIPQFQGAMHMARLRSAGTDFSGIIQSARIRSVQDNTFYSLYILTGGLQPQAYVDINKNGSADTGEPIIVMSSEVVPVAAASAPSTSNLKNKFLAANPSLPVGDASSSTTPITFSPRGLPCTTQTATGGTVCDSAGGATAFWVFFKNKMTSTWEAVTITPAGRIQKWQYSSGAWAKI